MSIAANLKRLRAERQLSQPKLAEASGVSQQLISQIERGENVSTKYLPALAKALGVLIEDLDARYRPSMTEEASEILSTFDRLSEAGRKKLLARARDLRSQESD